MILTARRLALVAGLSLPLAFASAAYAQTAPQGPEGAAPPDAAQHHHRSAEERAAAHAARLRAMLQLRPDQDAALAAFLGAMRPPQSDMARTHGDRDANEALPAPQRMERMLDRLDKVRAEMGRKLEALRAFYAQLSPEQQKAFDALGDMGHRRGGHHDGDGDRHDGEHGGHGDMDGGHHGDGMGGGEQPHG
ncbi:MAG: Spy/CpxP family protein refolding chaperone [Caulobacterales bacterium]